MLRQFRRENGFKLFRGISYVTALLILGILFSIPRLEEPLFNTPHSTLVRDKNGELLSCEIAEDEQWRFPYISFVPGKFKHAITTFEDKNFDYHFGIDPKAIIRAVYLNLKHKNVISGGSTLTMQVIRLSRGNKRRNIHEKLIEAILAFKLEFLYSKKEILRLYSTYAPFGGNVIGLSAASWRYYGRDAGDLSWAETTALAVLPNSPGLIYPGRNEKPFLDKRNKLLKRLYMKGIISLDTYNLALLEPLPSKPKPLPNFGRHLLNRSKRDGYLGQNIETTVDIDLQKKVSNIVNTHQEHLNQKGIFNSAALVIEIESGNTLAYIGNSSSNEARIHGNSVDIISSKRSPGSLLKPILYALAMDDGITTPRGYIEDIPLFYKGFKPENYTYSFAGIVNSNKALQMSLNIPFVNLLNTFDYTRFYDELAHLGLKFPYESDHYGLTMILGGAETTLWDLTSLYAGAARTLNLYNDEGILSVDTYHLNSYIKEERNYRNSEYSYISPGSIFTMFSTMTKLTRPNTVGNWEVFNSSYPIAWKTGTSTGFKDAWALGLTKEYLVGIWTGNADGEGRAELVGVKTSAPILFDVFKVLPRTSLFNTPVSNMITRDICSESGLLAGPNCPVKTKEVIPDNSDYRICSYHKIIHLDEFETNQVKSPYLQYKMVSKPWLQFNPVIEWYYKKANPGYKPPPDFIENDESPMEFIYPSKSSHIYVPVEIDGEKGHTIFEVAHKEESTLYWHLDGKYIGLTEDFHQKLLNPAIGKHTITVIDNNGNEINRMFEIIK